MQYTENKTALRELKIAIIGLGRVGTALAGLLLSGGGGKLHLCGREAAGRRQLDERLAGGFSYFSEPGSAVADCDLVLLAVQDRYLPEMARQLAGSLKPGAMVAHCSGALTAAVLEPLRVHGVRTFSLHPLQSLADVEAARAALPGSWFSFEGDEEAYSMAEALVAACEGRLVRIDSAAKPLYHAAAVVSSNFFVVIEDLAVRLLSGVGVDQDTARRMLLPLIRGSLANLEKMAPLEALTGPIVRGDDATVASHLAAISAKFPELLPAYRQLASLNVEMAVRKGSVTPADFPSLKKI